MMSSSSSSSIEITGKIVDRRIIRIDTNLILNLPGRNANVCTGTNPGTIQTWQSPVRAEVVSS